MMLDDFMVRAALAGLGVALAAAPLGSFVVWRRMAYFGDATAHAAILGVAMALAFSMSVFVGALAMSLIMATTVSALSGRGYAMDTMLGVLAHSALAFGLVAVSFLSGVRIDLMAYLFGDILAVSRGDLLVIWGGAAGVSRRHADRRGLCLGRFAAFLSRRHAHRPHHCLRRGPDLCRDRADWQRAATPRPDIRLKQSE